MNINNGTIRRRRSLAIIGIFAFAVVVRVGVLYLVPHALQADPEGLGWLAENMVRFGTFGRGDLATAYRPPLYPLMLYGCVILRDWQLAAIGALHVALGVGTSLLTFLLAERRRLGRRQAIAAAILVACDPVLLLQSTQLTSYTAAAFFVVLGLVAIDWALRRRSFGPMYSAGNAFALCVLCSPELLLWAILVGVVFLARECRKTLKNDAFTPADFKMPGAFCFGLLIMLTPWIIRNQHQFGWPIVTTTDGGFALWQGNNPLFYRWLRSGPRNSDWHAQDNWRFRRTENELPADRAAYADAFKTIRKQSRTFCYACLVRLGRFWTPFQHQLSPHEPRSIRITRWVIAAWYSAEFFLAFLGLWRMRRKSTPLPSCNKLASNGGDAARASSRSPAASSRLPALRTADASFWLFGFLLIAALMASHIFYWTEFWTRAPAMPFVALVAAVGLSKRPAKRQAGQLADDGHSLSHSDGDAACAVPATA